MKIALIHPPFPSSSLVIRVTNNFNFPLGLGYIAAYVKRAGHVVKIFDPEPGGMPLEQMWSQISEFGPDVVGITSVTPNFMSARQLAIEAKRRFNCLVIMGGPHASALPRSTLQSIPGLDAVIPGEGEVPMLAIAGEFDASGKVDFRKIPGAAFLEGGEYKENPRPEPITDLDALPYPARDLVDLSLYYPHRWLFGGKKSTTLISSRGCPGQCTFCANICMGRKFRPYSPGYVVGEMEYLMREYGIRRFKIDDDCFTANPGRVSDICDLIIDKKIDVAWAISGRVNTLLDETLISKMKRAGCKQVLLGIESGNQRVLDTMKKGITLAAAEECCAKLRRQGLIYANTFIIGNEGETRESVFDTIQFAKKLNADITTFFLLIPLPGTPLFDKYFKDYDRPDTDWTNWSAQGLGRPYGPRQTALSMNDILRLRAYSFQQFYSNPFRLMRTLAFGMRWE